MNKQLTLDHFCSEDTPRLFQNEGGTPISEFAICRTLVGHHWGQHYHLKDDGLILTSLGKEGGLVAFCSLGVAFKLRAMSHE